MIPSLTSLIPATALANPAAPGGAVIQPASEHIPDSLDLLRQLNNEEVFTPAWVANAMLDLLPASTWSNPSLRFLDPACKSGVFLREIAKRLYRGLAEQIPDPAQRKEHIFKKMLFGVSTSKLCSWVARRTVYYTMNPDQEEFSVVKMPTNQGNIFFDETLQITQGCQDLATLIATANKTIPEYPMNFDIIIGNPPYQESDGGHGASASPLYHKFIQAAKAMNPQFISFIVPARWYAGGKGLDDFRAEMLADPHISHLVDYPNADDCFPGVEIKGGVCYFLRDKNYTGPTDVTNCVEDQPPVVAKRALNDYSWFIRHNNAVSILQKVKAIESDFLNSKVSSRKPFGMSTNFSDFTQTQTSPDQLKLYANGQQGWVAPEHVTKGKNLVDKWKVLVSRAYGAGEGFPHQIIGKPFVASPQAVCTETYIVLSHFTEETHAQTFAAYASTRFFRFMISLLKNTQDNSKEKFSFVPDLPMTEEWTDEKLYKRYGLTPAEIAFIEAQIKEMAV